MTTRSPCAQNLLTALRACNPQQIDDFVSSLSAHDLQFLSHDWNLWAREDQLEPVGNDWTTWLILGGRGAGKTRTGAEWVRMQALNNADSRIALIGETLHDTRTVMVEGISGLLAIHPPHERPEFEPSKRQLTWPNGTIAQLFSADDPESLRGPQFTTAWCDELAKWRHPQLTWDMLQFALRLGTQPRQVVTTTPKPIPLLKTILADELTRTSKAKTQINAANLAPGFLKAIVNKYKDTRLGRQELDGEILSDRPDALWQRDLIERLRVNKAPDLQRIVVAVDPPVTSKKTSDACGIIVAGLCPDGFAFILEDATIKKAKPLSWARAVLWAYETFEADRLVVEVNQGGEMVETVIRQLDSDVPIRSVRASRGKWTRAEPVAALYEQHRVFHAGCFKKLEDQMCDFGRDGLSGGSSPDRLDALVWALTDLMLGNNSEPKLRSL